jgi:uncharacterized protein YkvS
MKPGRAHALIEAMICMSPVKTMRISLVGRHIDFAAAMEGLLD